MPVLLLILAAGTFLFLWLGRRNSTLTRDCRWRLDLSAGNDVWRCAACGARTNGTPNQCLRSDTGDRQSR